MLLAPSSLHNQCMLPSLPFSELGFMCFCYHFYFLPPFLVFLLNESPTPYFLLQIFLSIFLASPSLTLPIFVPFCFLQSWGHWCPVFVASALLILLLLPLVLSLSRSKQWNHRGDSLTRFILDLVFCNPKPWFRGKLCSALGWYVLNTRKCLLEISPFWNHF